MDAAYYEAGYPYQRLLLVNALLWAAKGAPPIRVEAPLCVFAGYLTQRKPKGRRAIVHLLNDMNSTMGHGSKEEKQFAIREEVVPVGGVKVSFQGPRPARVWIVPGGRGLEPSEAGDCWEVVLPEIHLHAAVIAEYGE
jgi:hypothetical protein